MLWWCLAKGGGKSFLLCVGAYLYAQKIIDLFGLNNIDLPYPLVIGFLGRKRGSDFKHTTLETWKKTIAPELYELKNGSQEIHIKDKNFKSKVSYWFGGLDDQANINKFNSAELALIMIDQAEETERAEIAVLEASRRLTFRGIKPPYKTYYSANPAECWLKDEFVKGQRKGSIYIPALPTDNHYLPEGYIQQLEKSFASDQELLQAYRDGNWDVMTSTKRVIPINMIEDVQGLKILYPVMKRLISCDTSLGGDECVLYYWENTEIKDAVYCHHNDAVRIKEEIQTLSYKHLYKDRPCRNLSIDTSCKTGHAVASMLQRDGWHVIFCDSAEKASSKSVEGRHFHNKRAQYWWQAREGFLSKRIAYPKDEKLRNQLTAVKFLDTFFGNGIIKLEPKNITKQNIGQSPDRGDAFVYGIYGLSQIEPEKESPKDYYYDIEEKEEVNQFAGGW